MNTNNTQNGIDEKLRMYLKKMQDASSYEEFCELLGKGGVATWALVLCCPPFLRALDCAGCCSRTLPPSVQGTPEMAVREAIPPTVQSR